MNKKIPTLLLAVALTGAGGAHAQWQANRMDMLQPEVQEVIKSYKVTDAERKVIIAFARSIEYLATTPVNVTDKDKHIAMVKNMATAASCMYAQHGKVMVKVSSHIIEMSTKTPQRKGLLKVHTSDEAIKEYVPAAETACAQIEGVIKREE